jgi:DNA adenine methylase
MMTTTPFLKWAGGKRWLVDGHFEIFPTEFERYLEPFLGSGAVFFRLNPKKAILGDANKDLIETYKAIKSNWRLVLRNLRIHQAKHSKDYYYKVRAENPRSVFSNAAKFIYLNRTCWNALYRVNLKGEFNVPIGTKNTVLLDTDDFPTLAKRLKKAEFVHGDFQKVISKAGRGDFLFVDPPYTVKHNNNGFIKYNEVLFSWADQERLRDSLLLAKARGAKILLTNAYHPSIIKLYRGAFKTAKLKRTSKIAADASRRVSCEELLAWC